MDSGFSPMRADEDEGAFRDEWYTLTDRVKSALSEHWRCGGEEGDDFFIEYFDWVPFRFLCVEIVEERILVPSLVEIVHEALFAVKNAYSIDICNSFYDIPSPNFNVFVERERIVAYSESDDVLIKLGLLSEY